MEKRNNAWVNFVENVKLVPNKIYCGILEIQTKYYKHMTKHYQNLWKRETWRKPMLRDLPKFIATNLLEMLKFIAKNINAGYRAWKETRKEADFYMEATADWIKDEDGFLIPPTCESECGECTCEAFGEEDG